MTTDELFRALRSLGVEPEAYRSEVRDQVTIEKLLEREINSKVTVTEEEVDEFLSGRQKQARVDDAFNVSRITSYNVCYTKLLRYRAYTRETIRDCTRRSR